MELGIRDQRGEEGAARRMRRQLGLISRQQALDAGLSPAAIGRRVRSGVWRPAHRSVYVAAAAPPSWERDLLAAVLATDGVVSHRSAARLWQLDGDWDDRVEVTSVAKRRPNEVIVHRVDRMPADAVRRGIFLVTDVTRTLLDLGAVVPEPVLLNALDSAIRRRMTTAGRLATRMEELDGRGRRGWAVMRRLLEEPRAESVLERKLLALLRRYRLPPPVTQFEVTDRGRLVARVDLAYPEHRIAIEADGYRFHAGPEAHARDMARRNRLTALGWLVLHVTWTDVTARPQQVVEQVRRALGDAGQLRLGS